MATTHVSPGAYFEELDYSLYAPRLSKTNPAIVGIFKKGPTEPTFVSTATQFVDLFGTPKTTGFSAHAALSYLEFGSQLWLKRLIGPNAKKAMTEIPMGKVVTNETIGLATGVEYIISGTLNRKPIAGTVELTLGNYFVKDDGNTNLIGSSVNSVPHFIDYDTGAFMFTFNNSNAPANNDRVRIKYNYTEYNIPSYKLATGNGNTATYSGILPNSLIKKGSVIITDTDETFTDDGTGGLISSELSGTEGTINYKTGAWSIQFKEKNVTAAELASGNSTLKTFTGILPKFKTGTLVIRDTDSVETFTDNGLGVLTSSLIADGGTNGTITYATGSYSVTFKTAPATGKKVLGAYTYTSNKEIKAEYTYTTFLNKVVGITTNDRKGWMGSVNQNINKDSTIFFWETPTSVSNEAFGTTDGNSKSYQKLLTRENVGVLVIADGTFTTTNGVYSIETGNTASDVFVDNGDGTLTGIKGGTGVVNYNSGKASIIFKIPPVSGKSIVANYNYYTVNEDPADYVRDIYSNGILTGNIEQCDNEIDYNTGEFKLALVDIPAVNSSMKVSYTSKFDDIIEYGDGSTASFDEFITGAPLMVNSIGIAINGTVVMEDNGEGILVGTTGHEDAGNGTIDYKNGELIVNFSIAPANNDLIMCYYLRKFGTIEAISEGEWAENTHVQMYKDNYLGYGMKIWEPSASIYLSPTEDWSQIVFDNEEDEKYVAYRVASSLVKINPITSELGTGPITGVVYTLTGGSDDYDNITIADAVNAIEEFANPESIDINLILCPDFPGSKVIANKLIQICESRYDTFALIDPPYGLTVQKVVDWHNGDGQWSTENALNSSFAALYYPWVKIYDAFNRRNTWVPPSVKMIGVYAYSDSVSEPWFAPAGLNRGRLYNTLSTERYLTLGERDYMYGASTNVNPIVDFPSDGIVAWGQKTLQRKPSALDRVNVRRLMIYISKVLATAVRYLVFEPNDAFTWIRYVQLVEPLLTDVKSRRGLYEFKVKCDASTNTAYHIDNNEMVAEVWLQPTKAAEKIITRFIITNTGVELGSITTSE